MSTVVPRTYAIAVAILFDCIVCAVFVLANQHRCWVLDVLAGR
jgi:hypothetical protein